jgi:predicted PurR-regulated permease PerM
LQLAWGGAVDCPFIGPIIWATLIVVASWPLMLRVEARLGGRRKLAVAVMMVGLSLLLAVPTVLLALSLIQNASEAVDMVTKLPPSALHEPPQWLAALPFIGTRIEAYWQATVASGGQGLWTLVQPYAGKVSTWIIEGIGGIGAVLVQLAIILFLVAVMFGYGETATATLVRILRRLGGDAGEAMAIVSGQAIRSVALGVGLSAVIEAAVAGAGMAIAGVQYAGLLTVVIFLCALVQIGPTLVMGILIAWLFWSGATGSAVVMLVVFGIVLAIDNLLGPVLIRKSIDLPMLLIIAGVIGGLVAFGLMGIFVGPVVLAVAYTLLNLWVEQAEEPERR